MDEEQKQIMDEQVWEAVVCDLREWCGAVCPGPKFGKSCYYYAEVVADAKVLRITTEAQRNVSKLGYWRDVATGLSSLVDELRADIMLWRTMWIEMRIERDAALAEVKRQKTICERHATEAGTSARNHEARLTLEIGRANELRRAYRLAEEGRRRAEALAALVTPELGRLADHACATRAWGDWGMSIDVDTARTLVTRIKELLEKGKEI